MMYTSIFKKVEKNIYDVFEFIEVYLGFNYIVLTGEECVLIKNALSCMKKNEKKEDWDTLHFLKYIDESNEEIKDIYENILKLAKGNVYGFFEEGKEIDNENEDENVTFLYEQYEEKFTK